ncbi:MAG: chitobiase/beta-hexosaminidase C-terminal domain-containing protein [Acetatifactor sp.]|nr:chitobiase/beta-hexosaminidase C-terminal domain-containing protein [Acetatifactor sp.]
MQCPKCNAEIPQGSLYCEQCGEDIHIVPDFEPEIELNLEETINGIMEDINESRVDAPSAKSSASIHIILNVIFVILGVLSLIVISVGGIFLFLDHSTDYQIKKAQKYVSEGKFKQAAQAYSRALELTTGEAAVDIEFSLADVYFQENNKIEYEYLLREIVNDSYATSEQIESAYGKLIAIYRAREDYKSINELLLTSGNDDIIRNYQAYVSLPPEFSVHSGFYSEVLPVKLTAYGNGKIYYTLDGTQPDENSLQYTAPIILDDGDYTITAFFVNENGIASEIASADYHVKIEILPSPEVNTVSGDYEFPIFIEVDENEEDGEIYYTTDGTDPTFSSNVYMGPIHMPLGKSHYKFIRSDGTRTSEVVERVYNLVLNTEYTTQQAVEDVIAYSVQCGKINDESGHFNETDAKYLFQYQYVANILKVSDFYVIAEIYQDGDGNLSKTGNQFAVNVYDGKIYKLLADEKNNYTLVDIEE